MAARSLPLVVLAEFPSVPIEPMTAALRRGGFAVSCCLPAEVRAVVEAGPRPDVIVLGTARALTGSLILPGLTNPPPIVALTNRWYPEGAPLPADTVAVLMRPVAGRSLVQAVRSALQLGDVDVRASQSAPGRLPDSRSEADELRDLSRRLRKHSERARAQSVVTRRRAADICNMLSDLRKMNPGGSR